MQSKLVLAGLGLALGGVAGIGIGALLFTDELFALMFASLLAFFLAGCCLVAAALIDS